MKIVLFIFVSVFSVHVYSAESYFQIKIFNASISLPTSCIMQVERTNKNKLDLVVYTCDQGMPNETGILINIFNEDRMMELKDYIEVTRFNRIKLGAFTVFKTEATINGIENFIDAFCDSEYCIMTLGSSPKISTNIEEQLKN